VTEIIRSEGIVLKRRDFGETSRIAVVYTRAAGKVQLLAKGARRPKNKFGAALEPLCQGEYVFYWRETKELFTVAEATVTAPARHVHETPAALPYGLAMAEATDKLSGEGDADSSLFELLAAAIAALDAGGAPALLLAQFFVNLATQLGLKPDLAECALCGRARPRGGVFVLREGAVVCAECAPAANDGVRLAPAVYNFVATLAALPPSRLSRVHAPPALVEQTLAFIQAHLHYHTSLELKSLSLTRII